jgi:nickel/cobalt transporter (NicO) family protein
VSPRRGAAFALLALLCALLAGAAAAQGARHPFAVGGSEGAATAGGIAGVLLAWQSRFHLEIQQAIRAVKASPAGLGGLLLASFAYGVFHAAGPGHGKAVLASYMIANRTALRRGLALSALAALLQGLVAIAVVGVAALVFHATAPRMNAAATLIETLSYATVAALGARLVYVKGRALLALWRASEGKPGAAPRGRFVCEAVDDPAHVHDAACGHLLALEVVKPDGKFSPSEALGAVVAAGLRPCSGAILALVFTLSQGLFWAGVAAVLAMSAGTALTTGALAGLAVFARDRAQRLAAPDSRKAQLAARGAELAAALLVFALGAALLLGAVAAPAGR